MDKETPGYRIDGLTPLEAAALLREIG